MIIFGEHQSTVNENMPLRSLLYIGRAYERLVPPRSRYKKKIVFLPTPEFYTFYNGKEKWEKEKRTAPVRCLYRKKTVSRVWN